MKKKQSDFNWEPVIDSAWQAIEEGCRKYAKQYPSLTFHKDNKESFRKLFHEMCAVGALGYHKLAAILTIACLQSNAVGHTLDDKTEISIIPQMIAVNIGFSYMKDCMNDILKKSGIKKTIKRYYFPASLAGDTSYPETLCQLLYHEQKEGRFDVLDLADKYFLLEYLNLLQQGIEPCQIKAGKSKHFKFS